MSDFNKAIMAEFRANAGQLGGRFTGIPHLLLTTTGAKSGQSRTTPLRYLRDGERYIVIASKGGADTHPDWYYNLRANPVVTLEVGTEKFQARATIAEGEERDQLFAQVAAKWPLFEQYQQGTRRRLPVIILERSA